MKKYSTLIMLFTFCLLKAQSDYELTVLTEAYQNIEDAVSLNDGQVWDDPAYTIPLGFQFQLGSQTFDTIFIPEDGFGGIVTTNENLDAVSIGAFGPVLQDIIDRGDITGTSVSPLSYLLDGNPGSQILKLEWNNAGFFDDDDLEDFVNFQLWLYEGSNIIEYRYGPNSINNPIGSFEGLDGLQVVLFPLLPDGDGAPLLEDGYILSGNPTDPELIILITSEDFDNAEGTSLTGAVPDGTVYRFSPEVLSVGDNSIEDLVLFPNPASNSFTIQTQERNFKVDMFDATGRNVLSSDSEHRTYDVSQFSKGVYLVKVQTAVGSTTRKFIKN